MDADVVVIGAGAAGLAAALRLAERSVRVIVLEARDRAGGRVLWTNAGSVDVPVELGAEFIHGTAPETSALLREAGLDSVPTGGDSWTCTSDGALRRDDDDFTPAEMFDAVRSLPEDESVEAFLRRFERDPKMREPALRAKTFVEGFEAADPALASARSIADEIGTGVDSTSFRPVGSYAPLFEFLLARCARAGVDLRLGTAAERVRWERGSVAVDARSERAGAFALRARCAVITVPAGVLRGRDGAAPLSFEPPLPPEKRAALDGLEMGHVVRVVLAFRTPFWEGVADGRYRDAGFFRCTEGPFVAFWTQLPLRGRTIVAWAGGPRAEAMGGLSLQARTDRACEQFGTMLGERELARRELEAAVTHDWSADPFACGAYSYVATGAVGARAALAAPVGETLFFAGEATSSGGQGGTVNGAFETGTRAAREAARALGLAAAPRPIGR